MPETADFASAEHFLRLARAAHETGDEGNFIASRHLLIVALGLSMPPPLNTKGNSK